MYAVKCGTPKNFCSGRSVTSTASLDKFTKIHSTSEEALKCYKHYLMKELGYKQGDVGNEMIPPPNADGTHKPIMVLTKACRYGARMRGGKTGGESRGKRMNPKNNKWVIKGS